MRVEGLSGNIAQVNDNNQMEIKGFADASLKDAALRGDAYIWSPDTYDAAAADTVFYLRNDNSTKNLIITDIWVQSNVESDVDIHFTNEATITPTGTAKTGVNLNRSSTQTAEVTCIQDETANTQGNVMFACRLTADLFAHIDTRGAVILGYNKAIAIDVVEDGAEIFVTVIGYFE